MDAPEGLGFLLIADLHIGDPDSKLTDPEYRDELDRDLRREHDKTGPWDVVFIAGGLTSPDREVSNALVWNTLLGLLGSYVHSSRVLFIPGENEAWRAPTADAPPHAPPFIRRIEARGITVAVVGLSAMPSEVTFDDDLAADVRVLLTHRPTTPAYCNEFESLPPFDVHLTADADIDPTYAHDHVPSRSLLGSVPNARFRYGYVSGRLVPGERELRARAIDEGEGGRQFGDDPRYAVGGEEFLPLRGSTASLPEHVLGLRRWGPWLTSLSGPVWSADGARISVSTTQERHNGIVVLTVADGSVGSRNSYPRPNPPDRFVALIAGASVLLRGPEGSSTVVIENVHATAACVLQGTREVVAAVESEIVIVSERGDLIATLAVHTDPCIALSATDDGRIVASISATGEVALWRTSDWSELARWKWDGESATRGCLAFSPTGYKLAVCQIDNLEILEIDPAILDSVGVASEISATAKVVLVGRGGVGKTSLAYRLVEDAYAEHPSTHGMQFWSFSMPSPDATRREVVLWDLGGQAEYWLLHQLFLPDTELALVLVEPRVQDYEGVAGWSSRLEAVGDATKILVATKVDELAGAVDANTLERVASDHGCVATIRTSAKTGEGRQAILDAIADRIRWDTLEQSSRGRAGQWLYEHLDALRNAGEVVVSFRQIEKELPEDIDAGDLGTAIRQLARRGRISNTRSRTGEQFVVLRIEEVERYAGSLIIAARDQPSGVPALDAAEILGARMAFPRIEVEDRLPRSDECIVLDCVVEMLVRQGLALLRHGQLVFPSLFSTVDDERDAAPARTYFDFGGAIDDAYASLVARLALAETYGVPRMSRGTARFSLAGFGTCGIRRIEPRAGKYAGLAVFFEDGTDETTEQRFVCFVEGHLSQSGLDIVERSRTVCHQCTEPFEASIVLRRAEAGHADIVCQICEARTTIVLGTDQARRRDATLTEATHAEQQRAEERRRRDAARGRRLVGQGSDDRTSKWILVISDLHVPPDGDVETMAQALLEDIRSRHEPRPERIGALVVCGDLTNRATPEEFERAHALIGELAEQLECTPKNTIIVPGNHDVDWAHPGVYRDHTGARPSGLSDHEFIQEGGITLVRDHAAYCDSFGRFSQGIYETFYQRAYPKQPGDQVEVLDVPDLGVTFVGFNSAWNTAKYTPNAATIIDAAINKACKKLQDMPQARLRVAVWHHPITGNEKIQHDAFVERLRNAGIRLCLHGHVHENRAGLLNYLHPHKMNVVGTGSFGAPWHHRVESTPRLYHLIELRDERRAMRVHTRQLAKTGGAWEPFYHWVDPNDAGKRLPHFDVTL